MMMLPLAVNIDCSFFSFFFAPLIVEPNADGMTLSMSCRETKKNLDQGGAVLLSNSPPQKMLY